MEDHLRRDRASLAEGFIHAQPVKETQAVSWDKHSAPKSGGLLANLINHNGDAIGIVEMDCRCQAGRACTDYDYLLK